MRELQKAGNKLTMIGDGVNDWRKINQRNSMGNYLARIIFVALGSLFFVWSVVQAQNSPIPDGIDLRDLDPDTAFVFYDAPAGASTNGKPLDAGDFNGDGCGDVAIAGMTADFPMSEGYRNEAGHIRIVMDVCEISGVIDMGDAYQLSRTVLTFYGAYGGDMTGTEVYVGDFNADGYDDLLFGAQNYDGMNQDRPNAGAAYLIFGNADFASMDDVDLRQPTDDILLLYGATAQDRFGIWVDGGDFNGDGFDDLLIGANQADGENDSRINAGEAWIIFGAEDMQTEYGSLIDIAQPPSTATRFIGVDYDDLFGSTALGGDVNADGYDDAIISASLWRESAGIEGLELGGGDGPSNQRYNSGETFIIFGTDDFRGRLFDLAAYLDETGTPTSDDITVIYGPDANDLLGEELAIGDINGDGRNELALGGLVTSGLGNQAPEAGEAWLIYTQEPFAGLAFDLLDPDSERMLVIYPNQADSMGGDILRFGDINNDGYDELFYSAPTYDVLGTDSIARTDAGLLAILFGSETGLPNRNGVIVLPSSVSDDLNTRYILGVDSDDEMAYGLAIYDFDGDGYQDFAPNGMLGDGPDNNRLNAGEIYIISGQTLAK